MFNAIIKSGELDFGSDHNQARFRQWLKDREGKKVRISEFVSQRTNSQNSFYWAYLDIISRETGDDPNSLHEYLKRKLLPPRFVMVLGKEIKLPASTTKLSKIEMSEYVDRISALVNVPVPNPEDLLGYLPH